MITSYTVLVYLIFVLGQMRNKHEIWYVAKLSVAIAIFLKMFVNFIIKF